MALNATTLGNLLYGKRNVFNNKTAAELITTYGSLDAARLAACIADAEAIIEHITSAATLSVPGTGLAAGATAVTGTSTTGVIL